MKYKLTILLVIISASMLISCKGGKTEAGTDSTAVEAAGTDETVAAAAEPVYDLKALAEALEGCTNLENFKNGVAALKKDGAWLYVDKMGRFVDPVEEPEETESAELKALLRQHEYHGDFSEGLCWISEEDGMIGFIDERGEVVIPCQYEWAIDHVPADFHEGVCPVMTIPERELFSFIDKTGQLAFPGFFSTGSGFSEGLCAVCDREGHWGFLDKTGRSTFDAK